MFLEGKSPDSVRAMFVEHGCTPETADALTARALAFKQRYLRKEGLKTIAIGVSIIALGAMLTGIWLAISSGDHLIVTSGAFLVGGWYTLKGLWRVLIG